MPNVISVMVNEEKVGVVAAVEAEVIAPLLDKGKIHLAGGRADGWASVKFDVVDARLHRNEVSLRVQDKLLELEAFK